MPEFDREYLVRLPLPLAQLYKQAHNAHEARARHNNAFFLFEATIKLAASVLVAGYARELEAGESRNSALDEPLKNLQKPSLGQWFGILRDLARHFGRRPDAASHPLGKFAAQLKKRQQERTGMLNLYRRIKDGPEGEPSGDQSCSLLALFEKLVTYRNLVLGHGADRGDAFYEQEMGPLLFPAAADMLAEGVFDFLGPPGSRLVYLGEVRKLDDERFEVGVRELLGAGAMRVDSLTLTADQARNVSPNRLAVLWRGHPVPLRLDPLLVFREGPNEDVRFLNADRDGEIEYLSYMSGRAPRDATTVAEFDRLLELIAGHDPQPVESFARPPSVERDFEILAEIGSGGMGVVYLARQISLGRLVALKMIPEELSGKEEEVALARFNREIWALGRCDDPHIVKVLTSGTFPDDTYFNGKVLDGKQFYAMEYVPGADLDVVWHELAGKEREASAANLGSTTWSRAVMTACHKQRSITVERAKGSSARGAGALSPSSSMRRDRGEGVEGRREGDAPRAVETDSLKAELQGEGNAHSAEATQLLEQLGPLPELPAAQQDPGGYARRVAMLMRDAARALQTVHGQGIALRDVKPANLMLSPDGTRVVLVDFGLAKGATRSLEASRTGGLLGTLRYAAPEQLAAAQVNVGPKADVRGLGVTFFELLTRKRLFDVDDKDGKTDEKQLASWVLTRSVPRLRAIDPTLDPDLEAIIAAATERDQDDRLSAQQVADYLQMYLDGKPLPIRLPSMAEMLRRWVRDHKGLVTSAAAAAAAIVIAVVTAFVLINSAKNEAVVACENVQEQLARSLFERALFENASGNKRQALAVLARAFATARDGDSLRRSIQSVAGVLNETAPVQLPRVGFQGVAFSPDGSIIFGVSGNLSEKRALLQFWDAHTGKPLGKPTQVPGQIWASAYSPDGSTVLTAGADGTAQLWDSPTGRKVGQPMKHAEGIFAVAYSPDGSSVLTGSLDNTARLWDARTGTPRGEPMKHGSALENVAFGRDGSTVLTIAGDTAQLWDSHSGERVGKPMKHDGEISAAAYGPDGSTVLTGSYNEKQMHWVARLWNARTSEPLGEPGEEPMICPDRITIVAYSPDGTTLLTASGDRQGKVQLWDALKKKPRGEPMKHRGLISAAAYSPDGATIVTGSTDMTARVWDAQTGFPWGEPIKHGEAVTTVSFNPDGSGFLTGCFQENPITRGSLYAVNNDLIVRVWDARIGKSLGDPMKHKEAVRAVAYSPNGSTLLTGDGDLGSGHGDAWLWDAHTGKPLGDPRKPLMQSGEVTSVAFSPDGTIALTGSEDKTAQLWDVRTGKPLSEPLQHDGSVQAVAFSPNGSMVLTGGWDKTARLWNARSGLPLGEPLKHDMDVLAVAFSPDGLTVLTGSGNISDDGIPGEARLWDIDTRQPHGEPMRHNGAVDAVAFSPDGSVIVTGCRDKSARLWDARTRKPIAEPMKHNARVTSVAFSHDGTIVLTGSMDNTSRLWDARTARPLGEPMDHKEAVLAVAYSPDGSTVLTGTAASNVDVPSATLPPTTESLPGDESASGGYRAAAMLWAAPRPIPARLVPLLAAVRCGLNLNDTGQIEPLTDDELSEAWRQLEIEGKDWLAEQAKVDGQRRVDWHRYEAFEAESRGDWFAAAFHLGYLIAHDPIDPDLHRRRARAYTKLGQLDKAGADNAAADNLTPAKAGH